MVLISIIIKGLCSKISNYFSSYEDPEADVPFDMTPHLMERLVSMG